MATTRYEEVHINHCLFPGSPGCRPVNAQTMGDGSVLIEVCDRCDRLDADTREERFDVDLEDIREGE